MKRIAYAFVLVVLFPILGIAQELPVPDNRYQGYPISISWPTELPDLLACQNQEYYEPLDLHLTQYESRAQVARIRVQEHDECPWMLTRYGWRYILRPAGTKVAVDAMGRDLFDEGSPTGMKCANPRPFSITIPPPSPPPSAVMPPIVFTLPPSPSPPAPRRLVIPPIERLIQKSAPSKPTPKREEHRGWCEGKTRNRVCAVVIFAAGTYLAWHYWPDGGHVQLAVVPIVPIVPAVEKPGIPNPGVP
ncbi:MAG: hypothetical protein A2660_00280 [Candidatus Doudnabacteria bacterium RIFCSPHIGHO2_01_FULL_45_18]|uniref:Uncharacterized protein n=1 Tax=Candidatus Doudnabacteria bacterium RIFCSPHIGHO2_01_FULL_45_18 TaxID=1817823 RepID=A0A1F5NR42_9BACT|nr:MAG: hypothetical protein A2660_00280 [Candidatus Doudnabacteria bacterium RIFCSPHIGHO2_01_FULL_45_18]